MVSSYLTEEVTKHEKFAGKINNIVKPTGIHKSIKDDLKVKGSLCVLDKYLATNMINIRKAKVDG